MLGNVSSSGGMNPEDLRLPDLAQRCKQNNVQELVIATNATLDGQTTAYFISILMIALLRYHVLPVHSNWWRA